MAEGDILLLSPILDVVQKELRARENALQFKTDGTAGSFDAKRLSRLPWFLMQSNAVYYKSDGAWDNSLAKGWEMFGGTLSKSPLSKDNFRLHYQRDLMVPYPNVQSITISMKSASSGAIKAMREAKVKFTCYSNEQYDAMQSLYLTPGIGVLLQWGWSNTSLERLDLHNITSPIPEDRYLSKKIRSMIEKLGPNYDAMYGIVSDYDVSQLEGGGWECETTILSVSAFIADLTVNQDGRDISADFKKMLWFQTADAEGKDPKRAFSAPGIDSTKVAIVPKIEEPKTGDKKDDTKTPQSPDLKVPANLYIRFDLFLHTVNMMFGKAKEKDAFEPIIDYSIAASKEKPNWKIKPIRARPLGGKLPTMTEKEDGQLYELSYVMGNRDISTIFRSLNPKEVLFPFYPNYKSYQIQETDEERKSREEEHSSPLVLAEPIAEGNGEVSIEKVLLNFNTLAMSAAESNGPSEMIRKVLDSINAASGNWWNLQLLPVGEDFTKMVIIDTHYSVMKNPTVKKGGTAQPYSYVFKPNTKNSIVKSYNARIAIPTKMKSQVALSAGMDSPGMSLSDMSIVTSFRTLGGRYVDKFTIQDKQIPDRSRIEGLKNGLGRLIRNVELPCTTELEDAPEKSGQNDVRMRDALVCVLELVRSSTGSIPESAGESPLLNLMPVPGLEVELTIDGISGLYWGNAFLLDNVPRAYKRGVIFSIKDVSHSITNESWDTTIGGVMRIVPSSKHS